MSTILRYEDIPAVKYRRVTEDMFGYIIPKINLWITNIVKLATIDEQFDYIVAATGNPLIAKDVFFLAKNFENKGIERQTSLAMSLLWIYMTGYNLIASRQEDQNMQLADAAHAMEEFEVSGFFGSIVNAVKKVGKTVYNGAKSAVKAVAKGASYVWKGAKKGLSKVMQLTKKGAFWVIKKVFGKKIGGFICNTIELVTGSAAKMAFGMISATLKSLYALIRGKFKDAVNALLYGINESLMVPLLTPVAAVMGISRTAFNAILKKASKKNKMMALQVVSLVFGALSGNVQAVVSQAIAVLKPMIIAFVEEVKKGPGVQKIVGAIEVGLSIVQMIVQGVGSASEIIDTVSSKLKIPANAGPKVRQLLRENFGRAINALSKFKFKDFIKYLLKATSVPGMDTAERAFTTPSVSRLLRRKPEEIQHFIKMTMREERGLKSINKALQTARPAQIRSVIEQVARDNPKIIIDILRQTKAQNNILEALSA